MKNDERPVGAQSSKMGPLQTHSICIRPLSRPKKSCVFQKDSIRTDQHIKFKGYSLCRRPLQHSMGRWFDALMLRLLAGGIVGPVNTDSNFCKFEGLYLWMPQFFTGMLCLILDG